MIWFEQLLLAPGNEMDPVQAMVRSAIVFVVAVAYVRLAKKRFIAQASALDLVMAIVFGSVLSRAINGGATLLSSLSAGLALVLLHRIVMHYSARSPHFFNLVKGNRQVIVRDGEFDHEAMSRHDVTEEDVRQELRTSALTDDLSEVLLATLERSGRISIVRKNP